MAAPGRRGERAVNQPPLVRLDIFALVLHCARWLRAVFAATSIGSSASIAAPATRALVCSLIRTSSRRSARGRTPDARADVGTFGIDAQSLVIAASTLCLTTCAERIARVDDNRRIRDNRS
jgi:hypothetical protein